MVKTTHVGSLPFLSVEQALDYTFKFDIPVLFTLPKLDENQLMHKELTVLYKQKVPFYYEEFKKKSHEKNVQLIKYQLIGPVTYQKLKVEKKLSFTSYLETVLSLVKFILKDFELIFALDEPLINNLDEERLEELILLVSKIESLGGQRVYIHSCQKLSVTTLKRLNRFDLNLDHDLYQENELELLSSYIPGLKFSKESQKECSRMPSGVDLITPSCGLALKTDEECNETLNYLLNCKQSYRN